MTGVDLTNISVFYGPRRTLFSGGSGFRALKDVSLSAGAGECLGIIGESGSGKSTLARVITGMLAPSDGEVRIAGERVSRRRSADLLRRVQMVFQDPYSSLNPVWPVWKCIAEGLLIRGEPASSARARAEALMQRVALDPALASNRPHALSGGQRQRAAIARALAVDPDILVLDEPTSALDLTVQAGILNLLLELQETRGLTYILISHDIDVIAHLAHRICVMRAGEVIECGVTAELLAAPAEAYTRALIDASPRIAGASR